MFYTAAKQMHKPSCDDQAAMFSTYSPSVNSRSGSLSGRVLVDDADPHRIEGDFSFGGSLASGDVDGDGLEEVVAGDVPRVRVLEGTETSSEQALVLEGGGSSTFGTRALAEDVTGDSVADVVVGDLGGNSSPCGARVFSGTPLALVTVIEGPLESGCGYALATVDLDGDGSSDLVLGAYGAEGGRGAVYGVFGPLGAVDAVDLADADAVVVGEEVGDAFGVSLAGGDLDGDGAPDLLAGASNTGEALVLSGPLVGCIPAENAEVRLVGTSAGDGTGWRVAVADLGGDGDAVLDAVVTASSQVSLVRGPLMASVLLAEEADGTLSGGTVEALDARDVDGDGCLDLLLGVPASEGGVGGAALLLGGPE